VLACEVMIGTPGVKNIIREGLTQKLHTEMQMGRKLGMQTLDSVLIDHYKAGLITYDCCLEHARDMKTVKDRLHEGKEDM
jgi:twitching motility protein PilT